VARTCTVCRHPERDAVERDLAQGLPYRDIASRHGLSRDAVRRHRNDHLAPMLAKVQAARERKGSRLLDRVEDLYARARRVLDAAEAEGRASLSLAAIRELRSTCELLGRITGELNDRPEQTINVLVAPEWHAVRAAMLDALAAHPEARLAVRERLDALAGAPALPGAERSQQADFESVGEAS
jgi:hypothetical protein